MADEETKQLLKDILAAQREQLEYLQRQDRTYMDHAKAYERNSELHRQVLEAQPWVIGIRLFIAVGIVALLAYLVLRG